MPERIDRELELEVPIAALWHALTDDEWLAEWLADEVELDLRPGGEARFRIGDAERTGWVEEILPPRPAGRSGRVLARLAFWWTQDDEPASRVEFELTPVEENRTRLRVTESRPLDVLDLVGVRLPGAGGSTYGPALLAAWMKPDDAAGAVFGALADPTRRQLLSAIAEHPATATELAGTLPISRQAVVKHLNALTAAGLLERLPTGRQVRYRVTPAPLSEAVSWMAEVGGQWDDRLAALARSLST